MFSIFDHRNLIIPIHTTNNMDVESILQYIAISSYNLARKILVSLQKDKASKIKFWTWSILNKTIK